MYLLIFESIGMQELILIGVIALIVFGPRKLPQMARTVGKVMADFRKATNDFKETWEKEVNFEEFKEDKQIKNISPVENSIAKIAEAKQIPISAPEIKEIKQFDLEKIKSAALENAAEAPAVKATTGKQDWL